jgi:acyl-CoA thioesterase-1
LRDVIAARTVSIVDGLAASRAAWRGAWLSLICVCVACVSFDAAAANSNVNPNAPAAPSGGVKSLPSIVVLGDSLSAEYGIDRDTGWVALMRKKLTQSSLNYNVVNASISGETTEGGLTRLPAVLKRAHPSLVIVELGANDALRGVPLDTTTANLRHIIEASQAIGAKVVVIGMRIPPNFGPDYADKFYNTFGDLAKRYHAGYVPFLLDGIADDPSQFQADQIHPTAAAQPRLLDNIWPSVQPLLNGKS